MPRPCCLRHVGFRLNAGFFKPAGVPACTLEQVTLTLDEVEALRLADLEGLYQEQAAKRMRISRPTSRASSRRPGAKWRTRSFTAKRFAWKAAP